VIPTPATVYCERWQEREHRPSGVIACTAVLGPAECVQMADPVNLIRRLRRPDEAAIIDM
jgi:hypothetical protein